MRLTAKLFLLSIVVFFLFSLPLFADQPDSKFDRTEVEKRDFLRKKHFDPNLPSYDEPLDNFRDRHFKQREMPAYNSAGAPLTPQEQKEMQAIIDDFLVNDDTTGGCVQRHPAIARDPSGNFVITWYDHRNGHRDIYTQRYNSSGTPIGFNFKVNDDAGTVSQTLPAISLDSSGNFVITWKDYRNGDWDIYAQRYNSSGSPLGSNFMVNDVAGTAEDWSMSPIAMDGSGSFVITWGDARNGDWDIYAQRYNSSGTPTGSNFKVNDDAGTAYQYYPDVAMDGTGNFIITWKDGRNESVGDIYAQRYDSSATPIGSNFVVNDDTVSARQNSPPAIDTDGSGNFVITWEDDRDGKWDIYAQRYTFSGTALGANFKVNDETGYTDGYSPPAIAIDDSGNFTIIWEDDRGDPLGDIYAQRYNASGVPINSNFKVNDDTGSAEQYSPPAIATDGFGKFVITWYDYRNGNWDIYAQRYDSTGTPLNSNFRVNDDGASSNQGSPAIAADSSGNFAITWMDRRNGVYPDIYAQRYSSSGASLDSNFKVNDTVTNISSYQRNYSSAIAVDCSGNFVITWADCREDNPDIYAQRYDSSGTPVGSNFKVNDDPDSAWQFYSPAIAMDCSGNFVIAWEDNRNGDSSIYAQRYDFSGNPLGSNFKVNEDAGFTDGYSPPAIAMDGSGNYVIVWEDDRDDPYGDIYAQRYNSSGNPVDTNFKVNDDTGSAMQYSPPAIAMDNSGDFVITWYDYRNDNWDVYAQRYDSSGNPVGSNFMVNDNGGFASQSLSAIAINSCGNFVIAWEDYRNGNGDIYAQRYYSSGIPIGDNYLVPNPLCDSFAQQFPAIIANDCYIYYTWQDNRRTKGWDIYANRYYFLRGNVNGDGQLSLSDIVYLISYLYKYGPEPIPEVGIGDANCDEQVSLSDIVYLINYLYKQGPPPCP